MAIEPYTCALDPETKTTLKVYLFKNVKNLESIRKNVTSGSWACACVQPRLVLHPLQLAAAANRAALARHAGALVTRSVFSELLFNLSLSKNISQSLAKFGIADGQELLVCFLESSKDSSAAILSEIDGDMCPIEELKSFVNLKEVKSVYKLNKFDNASDEELLDIVISRMVTKHFVSH